jgi:arylsulfatase A
MYPGSVRSQRFSLVNGKELYDLQADPGEEHEVSAKYPDKAAELRKAYESWYRDAIAERGFQRFPIQVGHREENPVVIAAPQAYLNGAMRYHGRAGYAHDWITDWTRVEDWVHWEIDVVTAGRYEVSVRYLCPKEDAGARFAVRAAGASVEGQIRESTPMERIPSKAIIPENNYPEMRWASLGLGTMELPKGRTQLVVRALSKPGGRVMDLKEVVLRRV